MFKKSEFEKYATQHSGINGNTLHDYQKHVSGSTFVNPTNLTPYIIEERQLNATQLDVFSRLMMDRIIFMGTGVPTTATYIILVAVAAPALTQLRSLMWLSFYHNNINQIVWH